MLMDAKATVEGCRALLYWGVLQADLEKHHPDEAVRQKAGDFLGLMTPVIKAYCTDKGFAIADRIRVATAASSSDLPCASRAERSASPMVLSRGHPFIRPYRGNAENRLHR